MSSTQITQYPPWDLFMKSKYVVVFGYPAKENVPAHLIPADQRYIFSYRYGHVVTGYYGQVVGVWDEPYEEIAQGDPTAGFRLMTLSSNSKVLTIPPEVAEYLDMSGPPRRYVLLTQTRCIHYAFGSVMYGYVCQIKEDHDCDENCKEDHDCDENLVQFAHTHRYSNSYHYMSHHRTHPTLYFWGVSLQDGEIQVLEDTADGNHYHQPKRVADLNQEQDQLIRQLNRHHQIGESEIDELSDL